jgi:hypothetical protein
VSGIPNFIVHYNRGEPFRSITSLPAHDWPETVKQLNETNAWGLARFSDPNYLTQRLEVERHLRRNFIEKSGKPELEHPIYFFLGQHERFEEHERNRGYVIELADISPNAVSFTYGDSMLSFIEHNRSLSGKPYENPLCEKVYRIEELQGLFSDRRFPSVSPLRIEAQLWVIPPQEIVKRPTPSPG